jgi:protein-tyrosine phosphatase
MGNICRSPLAEGLFLDLLRKEEQADLVERFRVDSAGTGGWHAGAKPDVRSQEVAMRNGFALPSLARQVTSEDFTQFDLILAMDRQNYQDLKMDSEALETQEKKATIKLMRDYDSPEFVGQDVPDPYYGGTNGFDTVFAMLKRSCTQLLEQIKKEQQWT